MVDGFHKKQMEFERMRSEGIYIFGVKRATGLLRRKSQDKESVRDTIIIKMSRDISLRLGKTRHRETVMPTIELKG